MLADDVKELQDIVGRVNRHRQAARGRLAGGRPQQIERAGLYFARHEEHVLSRDRLIEVVWGNRVHIVDRTIDTHVSNLRKKIQACEYRIKAVHGIGYTFKKTDNAKISREAAA